MTEVLGCAGSWRVLGMASWGAVGWLGTLGRLGDTGSPADTVSPSAPCAMVSAMGATGRREAGRWCTAGWG